MHRVFRLRHLLSTAALLAVGLLPVSAFRSLGAADNFAILATNVDTTGGSGTVSNVGPGGGSGNVGAVTYVENPPRITTPGTITTIDPSVIANLRTQRLALVAEAQGAPNPSGNGALTGLTLTPGVYRIPVSDPAAPGRIAASGQLTLDGAGDYLIVVEGVNGADGRMEFRSNSQVNLINGANAANVIWVADSFLVGFNARVQGRLVSATDIEVRGTDSNDPAANVITGKLLAERNVFFTSTWTLQDPGVAPTITVNTVTGGTGTGTAQDPLVVNPDDDPATALTFRVSATDPDGANPITLTSLGTLPANFTETLNTSNPNAPFIDVTFNPTPAQRGLVTVTYRATDSNGVSNDREVVILVDGTTTGLVVSNITGGTGTGTAADPIVVCETETLAFDVAATATGGGNVTLNASNVPANLTFNPTLPRTQAGTTTTRATFQPNNTQAGTFTVTFTATDAAGNPIGTRDVVVRVENIPDFVAPTPAEATVFTVQPGQPLTYTIRAVQPSGAALRMEVTGDGPRTTPAGVPLGATHTPNENGDDTAGPFTGGDVLIGAGLPATSDAQVQFNWTPTTADVGQYELTYVVSDVVCNVPVSRTILINVTTVGQAARLTLTRTGVPVVGEEVCYTATVVDANNNPVSGAQVRFIIGGTAQIDTARDQVVTTDANGRATLCFNLLTAGTVTVRAFVDNDANGIPDVPDVEDTDVVTVVISGGATSVTGRGWVPALGGVAQVSADVSHRRRNLAARPRGGIAFSIIGRNPVDGSPVLISGRSIRINSLVSFQSDQGTEAIMTGVLQLRQGRSRVRVNATIRVLDAATPGVPADRFEVTILDPTGTPDPDLSFGGNLLFYRNNTAAKANDFQVRTSQ